MKYFWIATVALPDTQGERRRITLTKPWTDKKYLESIETSLYDTIVAILGQKYACAKKKPAIKLTIACLNAKGIQRKLARKMEKRLRAKLSVIGKQLELF